MAPVKCAPSYSCVPPPMGAVGVTLKDREVFSYSMVAMSKQWYWSPAWWSLARLPSGNIDLETSWPLTVVGIIPDWLVWMPNGDNYVPLIFQLFLQTFGEISSGNLKVLFVTISFDIAWKLSDSCLWGKIYSACDLFPSLSRSSTASLNAIMVILRTTMSVINEKDEGDDNEKEL